MFKIINQNKYDSLVRENANIKSENTDLRAKLDQLEENANSEYRSGEYCSACKNSYVAQHFSSFDSYGCMLEAKCKHFSKKENDDKR